VFINLIIIFKFFLFKTVNKKTWFLKSNLKKKIDFYHPVTVPVRFGRNFQIWPESSQGLAGKTIFLNKICSSFVVGGSAGRVGRCPDRSTLVRRCCWSRLALALLPATMVAQGRSLALLQMKLASAAPYVAASSSGLGRGF